MTKPKQNEISQSFLSGSDLGDREQEVLADSVKKTGFVPIKLLGRSSWWTSKQIGAFHYLGTYQGRSAILKIQGVKPAVSEIYMIRSFEKSNKSKLIRPPKLYAYLVWNEEKRYEALILEDTGSQRVVNSPTNAGEVDEFYDLYKEYRANCLGEPWIDPPEEGLSSLIKGNFEAWQKATFKLYPKHSLRKDSDQDLVNQAVEILVSNYKNVPPQFMHGHFSATDLYKVGDQIVLLSNLYWSFRNPFRDAVFGYRWFSYHLSSVPNITTGQIQEQRKLWLDQINKLPKNESDRRLLDLALLERGAAGLNLDALSINPELEASKYLVELTREEVKKLISALSRSL